jgi:hypothetical protein
MRLTLRTLLAYRDGVLSESDTQDLRERIEQTPRAANLLTRIDSVVRRTNLLPPKLKSETQIGDPSSVASYLDDCMPPEQVTDFERVCIELSDSHLAELAHCHKMLADAMKTEVLIPSSLKSTIVSLTEPSNRQALVEHLAIGKSRRNNDQSSSSQIARTDSTHVNRNDVAGIDLESSKPIPTKPDYLIAPTQGSWRFPIAIGAMLVLLSFLLLQSLGSLDNLREMFSPPAVRKNEVAKSNKNTNAGPNDAKFSETKNEREKLQPSKSLKPDPSPSESTMNLPANADEETPDADVSDKPPEANTQPAKTEATQPGGNVPANPATNSTPSVKPHQPTWMPVGPEEQNAVLLARTFSKDGRISLARLQPTTPIEDHTEIIVPPSMRSTIDLAGHCLWTVCGPTKMILAPTTVQGAEVRTLLCRALVHSGPLGNRVTVSSPAGTILIEFSDAQSVAAVELAYRPIAVGPITETYKPVLIIAGRTGQVRVTYPTLTEAKNSTSNLGAGEGIGFVNHTANLFKLEQTPTWYRSSTDRRLDAVAAEDFHELMSGQADAMVQLSDVIQERRPETAAIGIQTCMMLRDWLPMIEIALTSDGMSSHWNRTLALAEQLLASDPGEAKALLEDWKTSQPERGEEMFRLLNGSSDAESSDLLASLTLKLDSSNLDERVLAFHQLNRLTGKELGYQPSIRSRASVRDWRREVNAGRIGIAPIPDPLWEGRPK